MHKLESFATSCGSKISKPFIEKFFYPILDKKFICVSKNSTEESKSYDYYDDVLYHLKPYLDKNNISILEIGDSDSPPVFYSKNLKHTNYNQSNYILSKSLLYLGNINYYCNIASALGKKIVSPSNIDYLSVVKPYWSNDEDCRIIMSEEDIKPSHSAKEYPKTINDIHPEVIAINVLDALGIDHELDKLSTIYCGENYNQKTVDIVPGLYNPANINIDGNINIRLDKNFNLEFLVACNQLDKFNIITDQVIPKNYLHAIKDKLNTISFFISKSTTIEDIHELQSAGKDVKLYYKDSKSIKDIRIKLIDFDISLYEKHSKKDLNSKTYSDLRFLSKKTIIHEGKIYNSYLSLSSGENSDVVKNQKEFWEDLSYCRIYRKKS